jgi:integrase
MTKKTTTTTDYGTGSVEPRGPNVWRIRWWVQGKRYSATVRGTRAEANKQLRAKLASADVGAHVAPSQITLSTWSQEWIALLSRGEANGVRRRGLVSTRSRERYGELLRTYILPALGELPLQSLTPSAIDAVYVKHEGEGLSPTTVKHAHVALRSCLETAMRKDLLTRNPADRADPPRPSNEQIGRALEPDELRRLLDGFRPTVYYLPILLAVLTGLRRGELLALRWSDFDAAAGTLRIERAIELTAEFGQQLKGPKNWRSRRTISIDSALIALLKAERERHARLLAGVPEGVTRLRQVKLPDNALMFPGQKDGRPELTQLRNVNTFSNAVRERMHKLGFKGVRFHDLRATHATTLLDENVPVNRAAERLGHSPDVLLRLYAKRTNRVDTSTAGALNKMARNLGL